MTIFNELGIRIAMEWSKRRYDFQAIPDIAATELDRSPLHRDVDYPAILEWVASTDTFTPQVNLEATFGEPPITLFWHPHFYIEALFWCTSTTAIHGHGFAGAFQVLAGTSLQSLFTFESPEGRGPRCRIGKLHQTDASLLRTGSTQQILGGEGFVHSVFHLGYPSVTIVVRTHGAPGVTQYTYYRPGVAVPHNVGFDSLTRRLLQIAKLQATLRSDALAVTAKAIADKCDLSAAFQLLHDVQPVLYRQNRTEQIMALVLTLAARHGLAAVGALAQALTLEGSLEPLRRARDIIQDDELRLFLALLLTQQGRRFVMPQVVSYTGTTEPHQKVAGWIRELGAQGILKVPDDDAVEPFLGRWLSNGQPVTLDSDNPGSPDVAQTVASLRAEPLLAPLLFENAA